MTQTDIYIFNSLIISFSCYNWFLCTLTFLIDFTTIKFMGKYFKFMCHNLFQDF